MSRHKPFLLSVVLCAVLAVCILAPAIDTDPLSQPGAQNQQAQPAKATAAPLHPNGFRLPENLWYVRPGTAGIRKGALGVSPSDPAFDWTTLGKVTDVKDQESTALCWVFSDVGQLESRVRIKDNPVIANFPDYSEQDVGNYYGDFDRGGNSVMVASYLSAYGSVLETVEPWIGTEGVWDSDNPREKNITEWHYLGDLSGTTPSTITAIKTELTNGPVCTAISVAAIHQWDSTWDTPSWSPADLVVPSTVTATVAQLDHAVVIVGWDDDKEQTSSTMKGAWKVRNSWGPTWGESGYCWIGYGAAGIGNAISAYPASGIQLYDSKDLQLRCDLGTDGVAGQYGPYSLVKYTVPEIPSGVTPALYAVDIYAPKEDMNYEIWIYSNFNGVEPLDPLTSQTGSLVNAGIYSVELASPLAVYEGQTLVLWLHLTDAANSKLTPLAFAPTFGKASLGDSNLRDVDYRNDRIYLAGDKMVGVDVSSDPMNPGIYTLEYKCAGTTVKFSRVLAFSDRLIAAVPMPTTAERDYEHPNRKLNLDATAAVTTTSYPFMVFDTYNLYSWRDVSLTKPLYGSGWSDHPDLPSSYDDRKRLLYNHPCLAAEGNNLYVVSNRYQDRYDAGSQTWRFWWDLGRSGWRFDDPYNPTPLADVVYKRTALQTGYVTTHKYWYYDYDATFSLYKWPSGSFYGLGYVINSKDDSPRAVESLFVDKRAGRFLWDKDGDGTGERRVVASIVNSLDADPTDPDSTSYPGDPGDVLFSDYTENQTVLLSRLRAGGIDPEDLPAPTFPIPQPAEDFAIVGDLMFVAVGHAGVSVVNIADPRQPVVLSTYPWGLADAIAIAAWQHTDGYIYIYAVNDKDSQESDVEPVTILRFNTSTGSFEGLSGLDCYASMTGVSGSWVNIYTNYRKAIFMRARIGTASLGAGAGPAAAGNWALYE